MLPELFHSVMQDGKITAAAVAEKTVFILNTQE